LHSLSLRGNQISDKGATSLSNALKVNRVLLSLNLFDNKIQKAGADSFGEALKVNTVLQSLSLGKNYLGDDGVSLLAKALFNYPLTTEEVQLRKKQLLELDRLKQEEEDPGKKKRGRGVSSGGKAADKEGKKGVPSAKMPTKKLEPQPPRNPKTPEDPKSKKLAASMDDKKGTKKPLPTKGKKGKDEKDDTDEQADQMNIEPMFEVNNQWYVLGNRTLNSLNLCNNRISEIGLKVILDVIMEQEITSDQAADGFLGLFRVVLFVYFFLTLEQFVSK
jgi:hypothetical protein